MNKEYDVDIVVPWVDGSDVAWLAEKASYEGLIWDVDGEKNSAKRYRDLNLMKYWFRGIENFAPWVRKIHFLTWGHVPAFLNIEHPKLHIVNHKDFIPKDCLPTYNANAIEVSLHRIPDLAERFVYFNDDFFLLKKTEKTDFFQNGLPVMVATECPIFQDDLYGNFLRNDMNLINRNFSKRNQKKNSLERIVHSVALHDFFCNIFSLPWKKYLGFKVEHGPMPYLKRTWLDVWKKEELLLKMTQRSQFRDWSNVNQDVFHFWQIATGNFSQRALSHQMIVISDDNIDKVSSILEGRKLKSICINDGVVSNFDETCEKLRNAFEKILPQKSSFEK